MASGRWRDTDVREAAIAVCATVAALTGVVSVVADAVAADQASPRLVGVTSNGHTTANGSSSPSKSSPTIAVSRPARFCTSSLGAASAEPAAPSPCVVETIRIPRGATEHDVLEKLGEPQSRTPSADGETWGYSWESSPHGGLGGLFEATLTFDAHRLIEGQEYVFK